MPLQFPIPCSSSSSTGVHGRRNTTQRIALGAAAIALILSACGIGCGGKTEQTTGATDAGGESAIIITDGSDRETAIGTNETGAPNDDASATFDVPGSLFDAPIPDISFGDGLTAAGCYDCTKANCTAEVTACDSDPRCRGLALCVLIDCKSSTSDFTCLLGCAGKFGVTSPSDPTATKVLSIATCSGAKCKDKCPSLGAGDAGKSEASSGESGTSDVAPKMMLPAPPENFSSIDPRVGVTLQSFAAAFDGDPTLASGLIDALSHREPLR
ncbi:MAG: hypothetical protein NVS3B20_03010 [Polyangiales bacterium]